MTRSFPPRPALLALAGLAVALGGCAGGSINRGVESVHQPIVQRSDMVFDVTGTSGGLAPGEAARLSGWFQSVGLRYGDRVAIDDPSGYGGGPTRAAIAELAGRYGLLVDPVAPVTAGEVMPGMVRVVVSRTTASVPGCPDWRRAGSSDFAASTAANYGCATNSNLAAMVADPQDLVRGRVPPTSVDASSSTRAVRAYRDRPLSGAGELKAESAQGGAN